MRTLLSILWVALFCGIAGSALAQERPEITPNRDDIIRLMGQIPDVAPIREELIDLGFRGENLELAVAQAELVYRDPVLAGYIADQVILAFLEPGNAGVAGGLLGPLVERGLGHLSTSELRFYYRVERSLIGGLSQQNCGRAIRNRLPPDRFAELITRAAAKLNASGLREYYRVQAKAARIGAQRDPVQMSAARAEELEDEINARIRASIEASNASDGLLRALEDLDRASNAQACTIGRLFLDVVIAMDGRDGRDALVYMSLP